MVCSTPQPPTIWELAARQHGVVSRAQLFDAGLSRRAIAHRIAKGRLYLVARGVYAVGRSELSQRGRWMAAVLSCGDGAALSHLSAAALWEICAPAPRVIDISIPAGVDRRPPGVRVHRRRSLDGDGIRCRDGIPVTSPVYTLLDLATLLGQRPLEAAINEADKLDLVTPDEVRTAIAGMGRRPGVAGLRRILDRRTFTLTDSDLERRFLPLARRAGLPRPETQASVNGFRVDFHWPALGLVVETDGLRYHRTPSQQAKDRLRDQRHLAAGLTPLRFTHGQITFEPEHVVATLKRVAKQLRSRQSLGT